MQLAAHSGPQSVPELCTKAVMPSGRVLMLEVDSSTLAHSISPHQPRNRNIALVAVAGSMTGMTTCKNYAGEEVFADPGDVPGVGVVFPRETGRQQPYVVVKFVCGFNRGEKDEYHRVNGDEHGQDQRGADKQQRARVPFS